MSKKAPSTVEGVSVAHLAPKQRLFVERYCIHRNATRAADEAEYKLPNKQGPALLKTKKVADAIRKIEAKTSRRNGLERETVLGRVASSLNRDLTDLIDDEGNFIGDISKIPKHAHAYIDGFKVKQELDEDGRVIGQTIEIKLSPNASVQDMAMKHIGGYAAEQHEHKMRLNWDEYLEPPDDDSVEDEIEEATE